MSTEIDFHSKRLHIIRSFPHWWLIAE